MATKVEVEQRPTKIKITLHFGADTLFDEFIRGLARSKNPQLGKIAEALLLADERACDAKAKAGAKKGEAKVK